MKFSIITATFNSQKTLPDCMQSVLGQTYANIEYILVDGNSTDKTVEIIKNKASEYKCIKYISEKDKGIYDALNKGVSMATGDTIGFVHSDDLLANNRIIEDIASLFNTSSIDGVYGNLHYVSIDDTDKVIRNWKSKPFNPRLLKFGWMPAHPTLFLKSSIYAEKGGFDLSFKIAADYDFILRVFLDKNFVFRFLPKVISKMRVGGASNRSLKNILSKTKEDYKAAKKNGLKMPFRVILIKNISKIPQWFNN